MSQNVTNRSVGWVFIGVGGAAFGVFVGLAWVVKDKLTTMLFIAITILMIVIGSILVHYNPKRFDNVDKWK